MKSLLLICIVAFGCSLSARAWDAGKENLSYDIMYKWGLVNKKTGTVTIRSEAPKNGRFQARLTGATAPWADHIYKLRDTLRGTIDARTLMPYSYEKIAHEGGDFDHDNITYTHSAKGTDAKVVHRRKKKKDSDLTVTNKELHADGLTLDMLSAFYYMRDIDYSKMQKGETIKLNVFSGSKAEILTIHYEGIQEIEIRGAKVKSYHITFTFTSGAGRKTSDNMYAWLSTSPSHIPLLMEGKLPVGKVRAIYSGTL